MKGSIAQANGLMNSSLGSSSGKSNTSLTPGESPPSHSCTQHASCWRPRLGQPLLNTNAVLQQAAPPVLRLPASGAWEGHCRHTLSKQLPGVWEGLMSRRALTSCSTA